MNSATGSGSSRLGWLAPLTVGVLVIGTVVAFIYAQRLKREPLVIDRVEYRFLGMKEGTQLPTVFSPNGDCRRDRMGIHFRTTRSDNADVEIIGPGGKSIRTLARDQFFKRYREHTLVWDGRKNNGRVPQTGKFRVRVTMHGEGRVLYLPGRIRLHRYEARSPSACAKPITPLKPEVTVTEGQIP